MKFVVAFVVFLASVVHAAVRDDGFSYHKFVGPVSGEIKEVFVSQPSHNNPNGKSRDYVAKPDYTYAYGVRDPKTGNAQDHQESRDGDAVRGQYSVLEADGTMRIVRYTADGINGFQATVEYRKPDDSS